MNLLKVAQLADSKEFNTIIDMCKPGSDVYDILTTIRDAARSAKINEVEELVKTAKQVITTLKFANLNCIEELEKAIKPFQEPRHENYRRVPERP